MAEIFASDYVAIFSDEIHKLLPGIIVNDTDNQDVVKIKRAKRIDRICQILSNAQTLDQLKEQMPMFAAVIAETIKVTPTQIRKFYTYIKSIDIANKDNKTDSITNAYKLRFLLPKLAGSSEHKSLIELHKIFSACIIGDKIKSVKELRIFVEFFEAILDYHASIPRNNSKS